MVIPPAPTQISERIEQYRKGNATVLLRDADGAALPADSEVHIELVNHEFLFGCNFFNWVQLDDDPPARDAYRDQFAELMNYATLMFYWDVYERFEGKPDSITKSYESALWCKDHDIIAKGHPLVWHEQYPKWAMDFSETEMRSRLENRVRGIIRDYAGLIDIWDVINESQVSANYNNPFGRWVKSTGTNEAVALVFSWAEESNPDGTFLINDFDFDESYFNQIKALVENGTRIDAIGIQSHMHHGVWSDEMIISGYEKLETLGLPIHFTEFTILSGKLMNDYDYSKTRANWKSTPRGEKQQARDLVHIYRLLFSLPKVEAITWWDFSDRKAWLGAPAGLLRDDMSPKPAYLCLMKLVHSEWSTTLTVKTDADGRISFRGFYGDYLIRCNGQSSAYRLSVKEEPAGQVRLERS
ncbi:MAG: endo-1,4-beta-xylanase [Spirochaetales bacterium]|nr:endo-1,4-beta-xylanase [Spirochaetales bacterium]